jgi:hypothetical protein
MTGRPILYNGAIHKKLLRSNQIKASVIEKKPININSIDKKQTKANSGTSAPYNIDNESDNDDCDNNDSDNNTDLQELFNSLNVHRII